MHRDIHSYVAVCLNHPCQRLKVNSSYRGWHSRRSADDISSSYRDWPSCMRADDVSSSYRGWPSCGGPISSRLTGSVDSSDMRLAQRVEYLSRAIMCAKSATSIGGNVSSGEFLHELEEMMEVGVIFLFTGGGVCPEYLVAIAGVLRASVMTTSPVLSHFLFAFVVDVVTEFVREGALSELLYADHLVLMSETIVGLRNEFIKWKEAFESKRLTVNFGKTKVVVSGGITKDGMS